MQAATGTRAGKRRACVYPRLREPMRLRPLQITPPRSRSPVFTSSSGRLRRRARALKRGAARSPH
eukprot:3136271-Pleurochrysis_carterae.AAC.1